MSFRTALKYALIYVLYGTGLLALARLRAARRNSIAVLTFHRVLPDSEFGSTSSLPGIVVHERTFAALMEYLRRHCAPDSLDRDPWTAPAPPKPRVMVTFDDGWSDNRVAMAPVAERTGVPVRVFICPGLTGRAFPFWPERVIAVRSSSTHSGMAQLEKSIEDLKRMDPMEREAVLARLPNLSAEELRASEPLNATMSWDEVASLPAAVTLGSHTWSHQILTQLDRAAVTAELVDSKQELELRTGRPCTSFAYPNGNYSPAIRDAVERAGYRYAFTTRPGHWTAGSDPLAVPRINISENHLRGIRGGFSRAVFEYHVFWRCG